MSGFVPGLELCRNFYEEVVAPAVGVPHGAALLGSGSDVLGFDTERSTDHDWGPRCQAFVPAADLDEVRSRLLTTLPEAYQVDTLIVEATIHYLDLTLNLPAPPAPATALLHVRKVLDGLLGTELPLEWDDVEYALKGTGRVALTAADRDHLGDLALKIPLLG